MISHRVTVSCSPLRAFRLLTDRMDLWWPTVAKRGGHIEFRVEPDGGIDHIGPWGIVRLADVEEVQVPRRIVLAWRGEHPGAEPIALEISLTPSGGGTTVEMSFRESAASTAAPPTGDTRTPLPESSPTRVVL